MRHGAGPTVPLGLMQSCAGVMALGLRKEEGTLRGRGLPEAALALAWLLPVLAAPSPSPALEQSRGLSFAGTPQAGTIVWLGWPGQWAFLCHGWCWRPQPCEGPGCSKASLCDMWRLRSPGFWLRPGASAAHALCHGLASHLLPGPVLCSLPGSEWACGHRPLPSACPLPRSRCAARPSLTV